MFVTSQQPDGDVIEAANAAKGLVYACRNCHETVVFAKGPQRRPHFRHSKSSTCAYGGETWQHEEAKGFIVDGLRTRGFKAMPEVKVLSIEGDRRADVVLWAPQSDPPKSDDKRRLAFEVQYSSISCSDLNLRTIAYMAAGVPVIWIPVLDGRRFEGLRQVDRTNMVCVSEFQMPGWVEDIETIHGHLWIYIPETKAFWRAWALDDMRWRESKEWYDTDGNFNCTTGNWYPAARTRDLFLEGPFRFGDLRNVRVKYVKRMPRGVTVDRGFLVDLIPPGSEKADTRRARKFRHTPKADDAEYGPCWWENQVKIDGEWQRAVFSQPPDLHALGFSDTPKSASISAIAP